MATAEETVFILWCRLTGNDPTEFGDDEREAFLARPQVPELAATPYPVLLAAVMPASSSRPPVPPSSPLTTIPGFPGPSRGICAAATASAIASSAPTPARTHSTPCAR